MTGGHTSTDDAHVITSLMTSSQVADSGRNRAGHQLNAADRGSGDRDSNPGEAVPGPHVPRHHETNSHEGVALCVAPLHPESRR